MNAQVLSFNFSGNSKNISRYIVVKCSIEKDSDLRFFISPEIMHWRDDLWLIDLGRTRRYWLAQALGANLSLGELLELKAKSLGLDIKKWIHCEHPWQGIYLLQSLPESTKIYDFESRYCQNTARRISWQNWLTEAQTLKHYLDTHIKATKLQRFQSKQSQLLRAMQRLGLENIYDIKEADSSSMQKRFGYWISKMWEWSFPEKENELPLFNSFQDLNEFVWINEKPKALPKIFRSLEYSVEQWDSLTDFLREDINLLRHKHFRQQKKSICQLQWSIELYGGKRVLLYIDFRNPYPIYSDGPDFKTAISQAKYQFDAWQISLKEEKSFSDFPEAYKIVAWDLECSKSMFCEASEQGLANSDMAMTYQKILELENKLPQAIEQYQIKNSFLIDSHKRTNAGEGTETKSQKLWQASASLRPLFKYRKAKKLSQLPPYSNFLERNARDWWQDQNSQNYCQDFFKAERGGGSYWLSRNSQGEVFELATFD